MRVMLTGASGFVGRWALLALARRGADVYAVCRSRPNADAEFTWLELDLLDTAAAGTAVAAAKPDVVLHLAWTVAHGAFWTSPLNLAWVAASLRLAEAAAAVGATRFIAAGTCYEYCWPDGGDCEEQTTPLEPRTLYGISKDAVRRVVAAYLADHQVAFAWTRLFFLYGPGEGASRLVPAICRALAANEPARCSRGLAVRDFMDVRDVGAALAAVALSKITGAVNIASGDGVSVAQVAHRLGALAGRPDLVHLGALPDRPDEPPRITASGARLRTETGFLPSRSLDEGLADALRYWRDRKAKADLA
jgi:nucleoside-diphosphate-sugar epimerase